MCYLYQFARIMGFCFLGEILHEVLPLPVPASIYGLILLLAALKTGIVRLEQVKEVGNFLTGIFPLLFVPAAVGLVEQLGLISANWLAIGAALVVSTLLTLVVTVGTFRAVVQLQQRRRGA